MLSIATAVCVLATSNSEVRIPAPLLNIAERPTLFHDSRKGSNVTQDDVGDDTPSLPPRVINSTGPAKRTRDSMRCPGRGGYLRMRSKYRNIHQRDASYDDYSSEYWIKRTILSNYDSDTIPTRRDVTTIPLYVGMSLYHILDTVSRRNFEILCVSLFAVMFAAPVQYDISPGRKGGKVRDVLKDSPWSRAFFNPSSTRRYLVVVEDRSDNIPPQV